MIETASKLPKVVCFYSILGYCSEMFSLLLLVESQPSHPGGLLKKCDYLQPAVVVEDMGRTRSSIYHSRKVA